VGEPSEGLKEGSKQEAERKAREQKEENERAAKAAEEKKTAEERQQRETSEHQHQETERAEAQRSKEAAEQKASKEAEEKKARDEASRCSVPSLKGDSLKKATATLRSAHCNLGKVSGHHKAGGKLVVVSQKLKPGSKYPAGTAVSVTLGKARRSRR
jgi:membrane protein involved in colicin uptake